ncbi:MAG: FAD-dependent tricarballylate dehydrogenase TcuA [Comamonadaceae bacterium]|nr:FAD-dependent tricarballylate dehydrogenase TcuA [Comamonadaceae bacterium]
MNSQTCDVVVVGAGNAALCAAIAAAEAGCKVVVVERAPVAESGGNSRYAAGAFRFTYSSAQDIIELVPDLTEQEIGSADFGSYSEQRYFDDLYRVTRYRCDPEMAEVLVAQSHDTMRWLRQKGVRFVPVWGRSAVKREGRFYFSGEITLDAWGGGEGLVAAQTRAALDLGVDIRYETAAIGLLQTEGRVSGLQLGSPQMGRYRIDCKAVVLACGGFEANPQWRARYLGPGWELAKVRGTRFNHGEGIQMALDVGAQSRGHWSACHSVCWDHNAPATGDLRVGDAFQKFSYPLGIMVNARGHRFVDEGEDLRIKTYSKMGQRILEQPEQFAWQVFDGKVIKLLRDEYRIRQVTRVRADTLQELAGKLEGVDPKGFLDEVARYNAAVQQVQPFDPQVKDGRATQGLTINKSNWAQTIDEPPFEAYQVGCGITFTFGGIAVQASNSQVIDRADLPIPGLYSAGEMVGGLFYFGYPGGSGLMAGAVFGRLAGRSAALQVC